MAALEDLFSPHLPHQVEIEFAQLLPVRTELSQEKLDNISTSLLSLQQYLHLHLLTGYEKDSNEQ